MVGKRLSIVSSERMEEQTGQKQGAVSPFGYENRFRLLLMKSSYQMKNLFLHQVDQIKRWSSKRLT
ncbi:hypothetical protein HQ677_09770 [Enterococcus faecium]|nr:hypothetical protein [Enterococcus faecium]NTK90827.1 hypothetical protein [Enterococcus faecium]